MPTSKIGLHRQHIISNNTCHRNTQFICLSVDPCYLGQLSGLVWLSHTQKPHPYSFHWQPQLHPHMLTIVLTCHNFSTLQKQSQRWVAKIGSYVRDAKTVAATSQAGLLASISTNTAIKISWNTLPLTVPKDLEPRPRATAIQQSIQSSSWQARLWHLIHPPQNILI